MIMWYCLRWWYGAGWLWAWQRLIVDRLNWCMNTFSVPTLLRTWFTPYKQTFAAGVKGSLGDHIRAFIDKFISRVIGAIVRTILIFLGLIGALLVLVSGLLLLAAWPVVPLLPLIAVGLMVMGVGV